MSAPQLHVVIPVCKSRIDDLRECLATLGAPSVQVNIVFNGPEADSLADSWAMGRWGGQAIHGRHVAPSADRNISAWWNQGIKAIRKRSPKADIAILNSDCRISWDELSNMREVMNMNDASAIGPNWNMGRGSTQRIITPGPINLNYRLPGWCFILSGRDENPITANEDYRWWLSDDAIEQYARMRRGVLLLGGVQATHPPNGSPLDDEQARWYGEDMRKFMMEFGFHPHGM